MSHRRVLLLFAILLVAGTGAGWWWFTRTTIEISGRVVDVGGDPLAAITVRYSDGHTGTTDAGGRFRIPSRVRGGWVTASGEGYLSRTRAAQAGNPTLVRLFADDGETVRLLFGGDVMFGRRYYDANDDGDRSDGLLRLGATVDEHQRLLDGVAPMLADADLTIVNLESPLISEPWFDPLGPRPDRFHPTKEFAFASAPEAAAALKGAGVDIVGLGNNHLFDALDAGVVSTQRALLDAGYATTDFAGAGQNIDEAWRPAIREVRGQRIAVVACTTISGVEHPITYVASATKGGAAECEQGALRDAVSRAVAEADVVVVMIHGGFEYGREPSEAISRLSAVATDAGANLVVNHHPHVVGGLVSSGERLTAWTMGNLLFDQTVWPTFGSYLLRVDVRRGAVVDAYVEPIMLRGYRPVGLVGAGAEWVSREAQSLSRGPWVVDDGSLTLAPDGGVVDESVVVPPLVDAGSSEPVLDLDGACSSALPSDALVGLDQAWTGQFEDVTADDVAGSGELWNLVDPNSDRQLLPEAAADGALGVRLRRAGGDQSEIVLGPLHRLLVHPGDPVTVLLAARRNGAADASLQLSWYNDTIGPSQEQTVVALPLTGDWQTLRLDVTVPDNGIAVGPYVRLAPQTGSESSIDVDDLRVIVWKPATDLPSCSYVRVADGASAERIRATVPHLPGADPEAAPEWVDAVRLEADDAAGLPAGPDSGWGSTE
jgi:poly-gamma-glutamate synthesis protein (capsule biosynthesis protein)